MFKGLIIDTCYRINTSNIGQSGNPLLGSY